MSFDLLTIRRRLAPASSLHPGEGVDKSAAVAAVLRPGARGSSEVLLIRRAVHPGDPWSGQIALPGGRRDPTDESLLETAVRETVEEVGIDLGSHGELLSRLPDVQAVGLSGGKGLVVTPFVFALERRVEPSANHEVAEAMWAPIEPMARGTIASTIDYPHQGKMFTFPAWQIGDHKLWGMTYRMLRSLFEAMGVVD